MDKIITGFYIIQQTQPNVWLLLCLYGGTFTPVGKFICYNNEETQFCRLHDGEHLNLFVRQITETVQPETLPWQIIEYLIKKEKLDWPL